MSYSQEEIKDFKTKAETGDANAQHELGFIYYNNNLGAEKDYAESFKWHKKAAKQGHHLSQYCVGDMYRLGLGVEKDLVRAVKWLEKSAVQSLAGSKRISVGSSIECLVEIFKERGEGIGLSLIKSRDVRKLVGERLPLKIIMAQAENGDASAQVLLGNKYKSSKGLKAQQQAVFWFERAAAQGYAAGQNNLGIAYNTGSGVEKNHDKAVELYTFAASQGLHASQLNLGIVAERKEPPDYVEAVRWYKLAAKQGLAKAQFYLSELYRQGKGVEQDFKKSFKWAEAAANQNSAPAQYELGRKFSFGEGVAEDKAKAVELYRQAAEQGLALAQSVLAFCYHKGLGVEYEEEAAKWAGLAADQGDAYGQYLLGFFYGYGVGVETDLEKSFTLFQKSAAQGFVAAQFSLAIAYEQGRGVEQNYDEALKYFELAAGQDHIPAFTKIGLMKINGIGIEKTISGMDYLEHAAAHDDKNALYELSKIYRHGEQDIPADAVKVAACSYLMEDRLPTVHPKSIHILFNAIAPDQRRDVAKQVLGLPVTKPSASPEMR